MRLPSPATCLVPLPQLFEGQVPSVPSSSSLPGLAAPGGAVPAAAAPLGFGGGGSTGVWVENTLDEPVWATLRRDVYTIGRNMRSVLIPIDWDFTNSAAALGNWDLWGPLVRAGAAGGAHDEGGGRSDAALAAAGLPRI
jgi:hypothetical protein